jgi:hypothetical protein
MLLNYYTSIDKFFYENIINLQLYFNSPLNFNDPFDSKIFLTFPKSIELMTNLTMDVYKIIGLEATPELIEERLRKNLEQELELINYHINKSSINFLKSIGVLCFCKYEEETDDNILMWAHYADKHRGVCLKFDTDKDNLFFKPNELHEIYYSENYPIVKFQDIISMKKAFNTKFKDWSYEKEYRLIKDGAEKTYQYNSKCLAEVTFGCKVDDKQFIPIIELMKGQEYKDIKFRRALQNKTSYKLDYETIEQI